MNLETHEDRRAALEHACWFWRHLDERTQADAADGECTLMEYQLIPIVDYTRKHPIFKHLASQSNGLSKG